MSRVITIITAHFKSWYRSRSNIFWTIAFPLLLIVLFGAIFGNGSTKFEYVAPAAVPALEEIGRAHV